MTAGVQKTRIVAMATGAIKTVYVCPAVVVLDVMMVDGVRGRPAKIYHASMVNVRPALRVKVPHVDIMTCPAALVYLTLI